MYVLFSISITGNLPYGVFPLALLSEELQGHRTVSPLPGGLSLKCAVRKEPFHFR